VIALDARILGILRELGADVPAGTPSNPAEYEAIQSALLTQVCRPMGITGAELDRILYWSRDPIGRSHAT
jgi:hypothetical protein